jgi:hypothetical protein
VRSIPAFTGVPETPDTTLNSFYPQSTFILCDEKPHGGNFSLFILKQKKLIRDFFCDRAQRRLHRVCFIQLWEVVGFAG